MNRRAKMYRFSLSFLLSASLILSAVMTFSPQVGAKSWDHKYRASLPDSAFASVEIDTQGKKIRHLPHHGHEGNLDIPHLFSALARFSQVKWINPENQEPARAHLLDHYQEYKKMKNKSKMSDQWPANNEKEKAWEKPSDIPRGE